MIGQGFLGKLIECAGLGISLELAVPRLRIELNIPATKLTQFFLRQGSDLALELLDSGHS